MYLGRERRIIGMYNSFIEERILDKVDDYDEMLWQIKCIALGWHLLEEKQIISIEKYLIRIKKEVEARYRANKLDIKFLCNTGEVLYYINSKVCNIEKFWKSYNEIVIWWVEKYIEQIRDNEKINLTYEDGICCLIRYCLFDKQNYDKQINELFYILLMNIEIAVSSNEISLGMSHGIGGWLNVINKIEDNVNDEFGKTIKLLIDIYNHKKFSSDRLIKWPAIIKKDVGDLYTISDNWNYGASMILFNLLNSKYLKDIEKEEYYKNLVYHSYQPVGELGMINCDFHNGYAGGLCVYTQCYNKYKEPSFKIMRNKLVDILIENSIQNKFMFYRYKDIGSHLKKVEDREKYWIKNYQIYCVLCEIVE